MGQPAGGKFSASSLYKFPVDWSIFHSSLWTGSFTASIIGQNQGMSRDGTTC